MEGEEEAEARVKHNLFAFFIHGKKSPKNSVVCVLNNGMQCWSEKGENAE